jgi:hypothetical protein
MHIEPENTMEVMWGDAGSYMHGQNDIVFDVIKEISGLKE